MSETLNPTQPTYEKVTLSFFVPEGWGDHYAGRVHQKLSLCDIGLDLHAMVEDPTEAEQTKLDQLAEFESTVFEVGEKVFIRHNEYDFVGMVPHFEEGTRGTIVGILRGWTTPYLVKIDPPAIEVGTGDRWFGDSLIFYYGWQFLKRVHPKEKPPAPDLDQTFLDKMMADIVAKEKEYPRGSMYRYEAIKRKGANNV